MAENTGISGAFEGGLGTQISIATFLGVAWYNAIELSVLVFVTFNHYRGLYFWSLFLSTVAGVIPYSVGFLIKFFELMDSIWLSLVLLTIGWWFMITGQGIVLYSRLHLVLRDQAILRRVLYMVIANFFLLHIPTTVLTIGSNSNANEPFLEPYDVMEKIQMTGFCLQELIISTLYIWEAVKMLRLSPERGNRRIMYQLLCINFIFIAMDVALLVCAYLNLYAIETTVKATIYSIKLKLEFAVLGKLIHVVNAHLWNPELDTGANGFPDFVDASRLTTDVTHAPQCVNSPPKPPWSQDIPGDKQDQEDGKQNDNQEVRGVENGGSWSSETQGRTSISAQEDAPTPMDITTVIPPPQVGMSNFKDQPT